MMLIWDCGESCSQRGATTPLLPWRRNGPAGFGGLLRLMSGERWSDLRYQTLGDVFPLHLVPPTRHVEYVSGIIRQHPTKATYPALAEHLSSPGHRVTEYWATKLSRQARDADPSLPRPRKGRRAKNHASK